MVLNIWHQVSHRPSSLPSCIIILMLMMMKTRLAAEVSITAAACEGGAGTVTCSGSHPYGGSRHACCHGLRLYEVQRAANSIRYSGLNGEPSPFRRF